MVRLWKVFAEIFVLTEGVCFSCVFLIVSRLYIIN